MGYYSRGMHTDRSSGGRIWRILILPILAFALLAAASLVYCNPRVDRSVIRKAMEKAQLSTTVTELDRALLPTFDKTDKGLGKIEYVARPEGTGLCGCALVSQDMVEVTVDSNGDVVQMSAYQTLGLSKARPEP